jgi:Tfp pilus assembly protein PilN
MSTHTVHQTGTHLVALPRVNLLPPEIEAARRFRKVQVGLGAGVAGAVVVVGALVVAANGQVHSASDDLATAKARGATLQAQQAKYAEVPLVYAQVEAGQAQLSQAMGKEIRWSYFLNDLSLRTPAKVWLESVTVAEQVDDAPVGATAAAATGPTYGTPGIGTVTFKGRGYRHNDVAAWLRALGDQPGLADPYFTSSTQDAIGDEESVTFDSQAVITEEALSGRFSDKAGS